LTGLAIHTQQGAGPSTSNMERARINDRIDHLNAGAVTLYALSIGAIAGYLLWTSWPADQPEVQVTP
jgi:hypothetical protein